MLKPPGAEAGDRRRQPATRSGPLAPAGSEAAQEREAPPESEREVDYDSGHEAGEWLAAGSGGAPESQDATLASPSSVLWKNAVA
mgnify:CR=1 FL=1